MEFETEKLRKLYDWKNKYLGDYCNPVEPHEFYRDIFPEGTFERRGHYEDGKPNAIAVSIGGQRVTGLALEIDGGGRARRYVIMDELEELEQLYGTDFTIMSPISYFGKRRTGKNARYLYAMVFDLDGVGEQQLRDTLYQMGNGVLPKATYIVNSGIGLHIYYVLDKPIPLYPQNQKYLKEVKYALTRQVWNRYTSTIKEPQYQGIMQGFRMVGSCSKLGSEYPVKAFALGDRIALDALIEYIPDSNKERRQVKSILTKGNLTLEEAKKKYPDWYERRVVKKERRGRWHVKRALYDWWLGRIRGEIRVGHRYFAIMTLAIYAMKCDVSEDELRRDAFSLLENYDEMSDTELNRFTKDDIVCALEMYNEDYVTFPRSDIARISGLQLPANKRNGRKQKEHLLRARAVQAVDYPEGEWRNVSGRPSARQRVAEYRQQNPDATKAECIRSTGLSKKTVYKWWQEAGEWLNVEAEVYEIDIDAKN